ncbi:MAG TPA: antitoxin Xre/MbcA/ParS toxin-binding domain-containing protein [Bradyrhizobium sp.]|jgi:putative toxin-antitoxin system antitoxin component (TIGR02293 family)|nr:antitoxin Xre/MbcA/ParS toxin-binding domain-containing protein [Bradyrhizobium sp.]
MSARPLAELYEKLKEMRRRGRLPEGLSERPTEPYDEIGATPRPGAAGRKPDWQAAIADLIKALGIDDSVAARKALASELGGIETSASVVRNLEMRVLADRIFGDEAKAEAWLNRPNPSLSGQKPVDLLDDELGAAVVRETLEQIDHGIFA